MTEPVVVLSSPRVQRRRLVDLEQHPRALDGVFVPGAAVVGEPPDAGIDPDLFAPLRAAERLAGTARATVALVPGRKDRAPAPDWGRASRYTEVPRRYVDLLARVRAGGAGVPAWLQRLVIGQLYGYLLADTGMYTATGALPEAVTDAFHAALAELRAGLDDDLVAGFRTGGVSEELRLALLLGVPGRRGHRPPRVRTDPGRGLARVSYLYCGERPAERFTLDGAPVTPEHHKTRAVDVLGRPLVRERIAWVPQGTSVELVGEPAIELAPARPPGRIARYRRVVAENRGVAGRVAADLRTRNYAGSSAVTERYDQAWLLMDRDTAAQDNAEHLYRYLLAHEPGVNAWFVLDPASPDWPRLELEGFKLLAYGSREHFAALLNCEHLVSSQVDSYVVKPFRRHALGPGHWRYTFLQHGVIKDDLSRWLNGKPIDLFITSTPDERDSITADGSPYVFTDLEVALTGLARHDRLLALADRPERTRLVVMPTWRRELLADQAVGNRRGLLDSFWDSDYALGWRRLLESPRLRDLCADRGWELAFVPHPNMQDYLDSSPLPDHVHAYRFRDVDVQEVLASAAAVVTDYSSLATEAAYIERPVVYYQFDRAAFFAGGHVYRRGAWSYEQQGFGPVTETADAAVAAIEQIAAAGPEPRYLERMERTFPFRDGRCCERTVAAIRAITRG